MSLVVKKLKPQLYIAEKRYAPLLTYPNRQARLNYAIWKGGQAPKKLLSYWYTRAGVSAFKFLGFLLRVQGTETTERCQTYALVHPLLMYTWSRITTWVYWLHWIIGQLWRLFRPSPKIYLFVCLRKIYKTHLTVYESLTLHRLTSFSLVRLIVVFYQVRF